MQQLTDKIASHMHSLLKLKESFDETRLSEFKQSREELFKNILLDYQQYVILFLITYNSLLCRVFVDIDVKIEEIDKIVSAEQRRKAVVDELYNTGSC